MFPKDYLFILLQNKYELIFPDLQMLINYERRYQLKQNVKEQNIYILNKTPSALKESGTNVSTNIHWLIQLSQPYEIGNILVSILQMKKPRHREAE